MIRVVKIENGCRREMTFEDHDWEIIRKTPMGGISWELIKEKKTEIPVTESEKEVETMIAMNNVFDDAYKAGIITKKGAWYFYGDIKLGLGEIKARDHVLGTPDLKEAIYESLSNK